MDRDREWNREAYKDKRMSAGRSAGSPEAFADVLGGMVSCSRAVVGSGRKLRDLQVGQTGKAVRPNVYFANDIFGAIQHMEGMEEADFIIAINKDETVPIFEVSHYGIVGGDKRILLSLTEKLKQQKIREVSL